VYVYFMVKKTNSSIPSCFEYYATLATFVPLIYCYVYARLDDKNMYRANSLDRGSLILLLRVTCLYHAWPRRHQDYQRLLG